MKSRGSNEIEFNIVGIVTVYANHASNYRDNLTLQQKTLSNDYEFEWPNLKDIYLHK